MKLLPDGIYIGLSEAAYFSQGRLGSTDLKVLMQRPADYWWKSSFNPNKKEPPWKFGNDRDYGRAFHYLLLEGEKVYLEKTKVSEFETFASKDAKLWRDTCHLDGITIISEEMDRNIRHMVLLVENHPQLKNAMAAGLSEVTIFWTLPSGHRMRARFDKLLVNYVVDPKSFGAHSQGRDDLDRALLIVAKLSYDVQRYLYDMAREVMVEFIKAGKVFGATPEQRIWLDRIPDADDARLAERNQLPNGHPDQNSAWSWLWLFMQKPSDSKGHSPVLQPVERPRFDITWRTGRLKVETALVNFDYYKARFGLGDEPNEDGLPAVPWASINPVARPLDEQFPNWLGDVTAAMAQEEEEG